MDYKIKLPTENNLWTKDNCCCTKVSSRRRLDCITQPIENQESTSTNQSHQPDPVPISTSSSDTNEQPNIDIRRSTRFEIQLIDISPNGSVHWSIIGTSNISCMLLISLRSIVLLRFLFLFFFIYVCSLLRGNECGVFDHYALCYSCGSCDQYFVDYSVFSVLNCCWVLRLCYLINLWNLRLFVHGVFGSQCPKSIHNNFSSFLGTS